MELFVKVIESIRQGAYPCLFHLATGAYCPGCGGTRALRALLRGDIIESIFCNPLISYLAAAVPAVLAYWGYCVWKKRRFRQAVWMTALYVGIAIMVGNFAVKNYYLLVRQVDLLAGMK